MKNLKEDIKTLAEQQPILKNQRKTVHIKGERTMTPVEAICKHSNNREKLRFLYATQQLLKGVPLEDIEKHNRPETPKLTEDWVKKILDKLVLEYAIVCNN